MKRFFTVLAAGLLSMAAARAQVGIVAGIASPQSNLSSAVDDLESITQYHVGIACKIPIGHFALQPEILYNIKGSQLGGVRGTDDDKFSVDFKTGFLEVPVQIQYGFFTGAFRPYVFAEPFIGYQISSSDSGNATFNEWIKQAKSRFEYGFGVGGGLEITSHIQLSVQWFKNLGAMFGENVRSAGETWSEVKDIKNFQGIKFSLAILF